MEHIGYDFKVSKSTVCETIQWVENTLRKDGIFALPSKKILNEKLYSEDLKKQKAYYSGKKKRHTVKNTGDCQWENRRDYRCLPRP